MLRPKQQLKQKVIWEPLPGSQVLAMSCPASELLLEGTRGPGKRVADYETIFTDSGSKRVGDVILTDKLLAPDGTFTKIIGIHKKVSGNLYRVTFHDGSSLDVDGEHLWLVKSSRNFKRDGWQVKDTNSLRTSSDTWKIPTMWNPAPGKTWDHPTDPYILGQMVGDGTVRGQNPTVYSADEWTRDYFLQAGWKSYQYKPSVRMLQLTGKDFQQPYFDILGRTAVAHTKIVPTEILEADSSARLAFLQGLMDSDGCAEKNGSCRFFSVSEELCKGVVTLVQSLGGISSYVWRKRERDISENSLGGKFVLHVNHCGKFNPFRLPRKRDRVNMDKYCVERRIVSIELCGNGPATCFEVAHPSHTFVCKSYIVTHNTDAQLMKFRRYVGIGYGQFWRGVIFDREYKNLDDLVAKSQRIFPKFQDGARFHSAKADYKWVWPTGEELLFRKVKRPSDYWNYHGQEFPFIGWNELTKFPTPELYDSMLSCNRSSYLPDPDDLDALPEIPLMIFSTTNPYGPGHNWVKKRWIDPAPPGVLMKTTTNVYNPRTRKREDIVKSRVRLFCSYKENRFLSPEYVAGLESITDENKKRAWLLGDWDIVAGGALDDLWGPHNLVPRFKVPASWRVDRSMDWGSTHPFSVGWWAEATGEEVVFANGQRWAPPPGSLVRIWELYGSEAIGENKGIKMSPTELATMIKIYDEKLREDGWIKTAVQSGPADNQIRDVRDRETATIADLMETVGITWTPSDKSAGSRKIGLELFRQRLANAKSGEGPGIFFCTNCKAALETLPTLPRDEENMDDVDTDSEDHVYDDCRYRILAGTSHYATSIDVHHPG
jgi:hypothetical protein